MSIYRKPLSRLCLIARSAERISSLPSLSMSSMQGMMWGLKQTASSAVTRGLMPLDPLTEDTDDVELSYWEVVEQQTTHDQYDEAALTSPYWSTVEQIMRCKLCLSCTFIIT